MARDLENLPNVDAPSSDYPHGRIRDRSGSTPGTPVNEEVYGDMHQFFAKLLAEASVTPNNLPDNEYSGFQLFQALTDYIVLLNGGLRRKVINIGSWDMDSTSSLNVAHGISDWTKIRSASAFIIKDIGGIYESLYNYSPGLSNSGGSSYIGWNSTNILLARIDGGFFDNANYNDTLINRGYIIIEYLG
jgi:hypothetical protein